jgi:hypothetical protein
MLDLEAACDHYANREITYIKDNEVCAIAIAFHDASRLMSFHLHRAALRLF